jgi:hypothetical protein
MRLQTFGALSNSALSIGAGALTQSPEYAHLALPVAIASGAVWLVFLAAFLYRNRNEIAPLLAKIKLAYFLVLALAISIGANAWLFYRSSGQSLQLFPAKTSSAAAPVVLSQAEKKERLEIIAKLIVQLVLMKAAADRGQEVSDNWQYQAQTNAIDFLIGITQAANGFYSADTELRSLEAQNESRVDLTPILKTDYPDCNGKTNALHSEIVRINLHKGTDLVFTLLNDTKLADFRASLPECQKWVNARIDAANKKRVEYR